MGNPEPDSRGRIPGSSANYQKRRTGRGKRRKRVFQQRKDPDAPPAKKFKSASHKKIQSDREYEITDTTYRLIDVDVLYAGLENIICCQECHGKVMFSEKSFRGLGFQIVITCTACGKEKFIESSKKVGIQRNGYEVNRRLLLGMRMLGHGQAGSERFCGIMDLPKPVAHNAHDSLNSQLLIACEKVAKESMKTAVEEEKAALPEGRKGLSASGDGTYRKKGFTSLQGVSSLIGIDTGKVIGTCAKHNYCKGCNDWESKMHTAEYDEWFEKHLKTCTSNHSGSSGKMEVDGIQEILEELYEQGIMVEFFIGDGDSKVYHAIQLLDLYEELLKISKKECVGHVQKRMGTRLRNHKKNLGNTKLSDDKSIGGKGRLTAKVIDELTVYYGKAIRDNCLSTVPKMKDAIWATFYHKSSTDQEPQHHLCPEGENSWCTYQKAKAKGNENEYKHRGGLPKAVMDSIKQIYEDLTSDELLERCLGGFTQNNNESFNNCIWNIVPKNSFSGPTVLSIGVDIAVTMFNDGSVGLLKIMEEFDLNPGKAALKWMLRKDNLRLIFAERQAKDSTKEARQALRSLRLEQEENSYAPGAY